MSVTADVNVQASVLYGKHTLHAEQPVLIMKLDVSTGVIRAMIACLIKTHIIRKLSCSENWPLLFLFHFFLLSIFTFFQIQSICYYYLMNEYIKMKGFKRIAQQWCNIHLIHFGETCVSCVSADLLTLVASDTKFDRICFGFVFGQTCSRDDVGLAKLLRLGILHHWNTIWRLTFQNCVCFEMLGTMKWERRGDKLQAE